MVQYISQRESEAYKGFCGAYAYSVMCLYPAVLAGKVWFTGD